MRENEHWGCTGGTGGGGVVTPCEGSGIDENFNLAFLSLIVSYSSHDIPHEGGIVVGGGFFFFLSLYRLGYRGSM